MVRSVDVIGDWRGRSGWVGGVIVWFFYFRKERVVIVVVGGVLRR